MNVALVIEPVDLLFCRDGRPIVPGAGAAAGSQLPGPQVLAGALRTALLKARGQLDGGKPDKAAIEAVQAVHIHGPLLYAVEKVTISRSNGDLIVPPGPFIPMPADLVGSKPKHGAGGTPRGRLTPRANIPGWQPPDDAPKAHALWPCRPPEASAASRPGTTTDARTPPPGAPAASRPAASDNAPTPDKHRPGEQAPQQGYLTWAGFQAWQRGELPTKDQTCQAKDLWCEETRTQVALKPDEATAEDGDLFTTRYLRLRDRLGLYVELTGDLAKLPEKGVLHLGGDRRLARFRHIQPIAWPQPPAEAAVALALTPTIIPDGRCPAAWREQCTGLGIAGADPVSGWDLAANEGKGAPRAVRWAIRPGAVWHLDDAAERPATIGSETDTGYGWVAYGAAPCPR